jgi:hypothetical protein
MKLQGYTIPTPTNRRATSDFNFEPPQKSAFLDQDPLPLAMAMVMKQKNEDEATDVRRAKPRTLAK